ncbi:precorrin-6y C5,15-methyltransferase (decarboxylating) subunit CbiE [Desulfurivibrio sp. D14AmB]|uniref:precorrin-6y C5,15-methyltransferase (decarboxylating) subunit CbiE n=1 Tax=Desulfurivibrio sp. D14AmB TaxID=3374370 RepID=UPI00376EB1F3
MNQDKTANSTGRILVIGVGPNGLGAEQRATLAGCRLLVAAQRYRELVAESAAQWIPIAPLDQALATMARRLPEGDIGVLAGGDPLFFGIGRRLLERFTPEQLEFRPAPTAVQLACARFRLPWDDARLISLHGRESNAALDPLAGPGLTARLLAGPKTVVLTDRHWSPDRIAATLQSYLATVGATGVAASIRLLVAENLGTAEERLTSGRLTEIADRRFAPLNVLIILIGVRSCNATKGVELAVTPEPNFVALQDLTPIIGLREGEFAHQRGMITKDEVRAVTLHKLALPPHGVLWDLGAASGSVSIEAARLAPGLLICAVEKQEERLSDLRANIVKFTAFSVLPVAGEAPAVLSGLPDPDRIFIGGSGGRLAEIISTGSTRLAPGGRMVINGVTAATREQAPRLLQAAGLTVEISEVTVRRLSADGRALNFNPISIITGSK